MDFPGTFDSWIILDENISFIIDMNFNWYFNLDLHEFKDTFYEQYLFNHII